MRVLITGATGFVGRAISEELLKKGIEIYCLTSGRSKKAEGLPNCFPGDITELKSLESLLEIQNIDVVIHSAGLAHQFGSGNKAAFREINVTGTKNIADLSVKLKAMRFILISSVSVYGKSDDFKRQANFGKTEVINENFRCEPESFYSKSKLEAEKKAREVCEKNQIALTILRLATVIGEGDRGNISRLIEAIDDRKFVWVGSGENYKSLIYKGDAAKACLKILNKASRNTEVFNVTAPPVKMKNIVSEIALRLNRKIPKIRLPVSFVKKTLQVSKPIFKTERADELSGAVEKWLSEEVFSADKIKKDYGFEPETTVAEALRRQINSYQKSK